MPAYDFDVGVLVAIACLLEIQAGFCIFSADEKA